MLRFSLLTLLGVVLVAGLGSAALANPTDIWTHVFVTGIVGILAVVTLAVLVKRSALPFALGFALIGWLYIAIAFGGVFDLRRYLLTEQITGGLYGLIHVNDGTRSPFAPSVFSPPVENAATISGLVPPIPSADPQNFITIARSLWTLILATIGGLFASWPGRRGDRAEPP
jgi:hypothetical protein